LFPKHLRTDYPAKVSPGLAKRIFEHCLEKGYIKKNELCVDPFSGICGFGIWAASFGIRFIGVELEEKFCRLSEANIALHKRAWKKLGKPIPCVIQGDSRRLSAVLSGADCILTSPPFCDVEPYQDKAFRLNDGRRALPQGQDGYGHTEGQLGAMKAGDISMVCTSPPYADGCRRTGGEHDSQPHLEGGKLYNVNYSTNPQNLGNLPAGKVENVVSGIVTSPPWEESISQNKEFLAPHQRADHGRNENAPSIMGDTYGSTSGQIGQESGNTYWEACAEIYKQCFQILKPNGVIVLVLKSYIKQGRRVPLPMQTLKLLIHLGFEPLERIKAMLVKEESQPGLFGEIRKVKERKSFFRRNHEFKQAAKEYWPTIPRKEQAKYLWNNRHKSKKRTRVIEIAQCAALDSYRKEGNTIGHLAKKNRIDFEEILIAQKPLDKAESSVIP